MIDNVSTYVTDALALHLFFARIMKEHAFFLKVGFFPPGAALAQESEQLMRSFEGLLSRAIALSDQVVGSCVLDSGEVVTEFTDRAECQTQALTGTAINRSLTARALRLESGCPQAVSPSLRRQVQQLNRDALQLVDRIIDFKERVLSGVEDCQLATGNYPLLLEHILREAKQYRQQILALDGGCDRERRRATELFWNQIMMEHALFIRGLLDPTETELFTAADGFAGDYRRLLDTASAASDRMMNGSQAQALTQRFRDFKRDGVAGIEECRIRSLILPLLADHVLREANHYLRLLEE